ncbi:MAG: ABC transporter substrate-binding protein, partial [Anaerolineae bacterium]|nr:ABC transporter substrate-binding protein [Anaerolineae bacterium]
MFINHRLRIGLMVLALLLLVGAAFNLSAQDSGVLRVGMNPPSVLDPAQISNDPELALNRAIYDTLVEVSPTDASIVPNLATSWTISDDGLTYTFTLAEGVMFHDGSPMTSADVVFSFNHLKEVSSRALTLLGEFEISAPDETTVEFTIPERNSVFLYGVAGPQAVILKDGTMEANVIVEGDAPLANFNGTGPFILTSYTSGVGGRAVFTANANYWKDGQPTLAGMEHIYFADVDAQINALLSGELDFIFKLPIAQVNALEGNDAANIILTETAQHAVIRIRADAGFAGEDVRVRQALKYATDRNFLNELLLDGLGTVGHNDPIAPAYGIFYDSEFEDTPYDPAMACQLLEEAGKSPLTGTLYAPIAFEYADLAATLQQMWGDSGCINVEIETVEEGLYYDFSNPDNYFEVELGITGWGHRPSPQILLRLAYVQSGIESGWNESRYVDERLEELVAQANQTEDVEELRAIYSQVSEVFKETGPIIIPYFAPLVSAASARVEGLVVDPFPGLTDYRTV